MERHRCERCGELLKEGAEVWLEFDTRTKTYTASVPETYSQGGFPFGKACAKRAQAEHELKKPNETP